MYGSDAWQNVIMLTSSNTVGVMWEVILGRPTDVGDVALDDIFIKSACEDGKWHNTLLFVYLVSLHNYEFA